MAQDTQDRFTAAEAAAHQLLLDRVHAPAFFERLAGHGIAPQSEQDVVDLLDIGANLYNKHVDEQQLAGGGGAFGKAAADLRAYLDGHGTPSRRGEDAIAAAAARVAQDPAIKQANATIQGYFGRVGR